MGQNLALHHKNIGNKVWLADIVYPPHRLLTHHFIGCDVRVPMHVRTVLFHIKPDLIINCVGQTSHPASMQFPASDADVNILGTLVLIEEVRKTCPDVPFIHLSSSTVVGPSDEPINENTPYAPIDIYSANKLAGEFYLKVYKTVYGMNIRILRLPNLYGPFGKNGPAYGMLNYFIQQAALGKTLTVYGNGEQVRSILYIQDAINAIDLSLDCKITPVFVPGVPSFSVRHLANTIGEAWGVGVGTVDWPAGRERIEIGDVIIDSSLFEEQTGWKQKYPLAKALMEIREIIKYEQANIQEPGTI